MTMTCQAGKMDLFCDEGTYEDPLIPLQRMSLIVVVVVVVRGGGGGGGEELIS